MGTNEEKKNVDVKKAEPSKKSGLNVLWLILGIVFAVILVIALYQGIAWLVSPERKHQVEVATYMQDKYGEKFQVKFVKKRYGADYVSGGCDGSECTYMNNIDTGTKEYVYEAKPVKNKKLKTYVVYSEKEENGAYQIYETSHAQRELCGDAKKRDEDVYGKDVICEKEKAELKGQIEYYLDKSYTVDYNDSRRSIMIKTNKMLEMYLKNDPDNLEQLYNNLAQLLTGKEVKIQIKFKDSTVTIKDGSTFEKDGIISAEKGRIERKELENICEVDKQELRGKLEVYLGEEYNIDYVTNNKYIFVTTDKNLKNYIKTNQEDFEQLYRNLVQLLQGREVQIHIRYEDESIYLKKDSELEKDYSLKLIYSKVQEETV